MKRSTLLFSLSLLVGCAAQPLPRAPLVPPLAPAASAAPAAVVVPGSRTASDREPARDSAVPLELLRRARTESAPMDALPQDAEPSWIEPEPRAPIHRTVVHTVEVPVHVPVEVEPQVVYVDHRYDPNGWRWHEPRWQRRSAFPINTLLGAGVGAIIGHQSGRRDRGALIGGGVGLLLDLPRWWR